MQNLVILGHIGAPFGINGWLHLYSYTEPKTNICNYTRWWLQTLGQQEWQEFNAEIKNLHRDKFIIKLAAVDDRTLAGKYVNAKIAIERFDLPPLENGEYYWTDLIGLDVYNQQERYLGKIEKVLRTGSNDLLRVKHGTEEYLIPCIGTKIIKEVLLQDNKMSVIWDV